MTPRKKKLQAVPAVALPPPRTIDDVNKEFTNEACAIGDKKYKIQLLTWAVDNHIMKMKALDDEAKMLLDASQKAAQA